MVKTAGLIGNIWEQFASEQWRMNLEKNPVPLKAFVLKIYMRN